LATHHWWLPAGVARRSIIASFLHAFPDGVALLASDSLNTFTVGLVGRAGAQALQDALNGIRPSLAVIP